MNHSRYLDHPMPWQRFACLALVAVTAWPAFLGAQPKGPPVKIHQVRLGFSAAVPDETSRFKVGLWAPVVVEVEAGPQGLAKADLLVETPDSENVDTVFTVPLGNLGKNEKRSVLTYCKPGTSQPRLTVSIRSEDRNLVPPSPNIFLNLDLRERLILTLGSRLADLQEALIGLRRPRPGMPEEKDGRDSWPRRAAFETDPELLPTLVLGYDAVDLLILTTSNDRFLKHLLGDEARLGALAGWVRQGGRLVVSVSWQYQDLVSRLLQAPGWQPPLPIVPPADQPRVLENALPRLSKVEEWAGIPDKPFPAFDQKPVPVALLQDPKVQRLEWRVLAEANDGRPLIAQMPYGRGQVTLLAFDLAQGPFTLWPGRALFLKSLVSKLEPRLPHNLGEEQPGIRGPGGSLGGDLATQLQKTLDQFDVPIIPFGWVALFIIIYILIVGPLDYFLLKKVFQRLEFTWITFPLVVLAVSLIAYFTAYAVKGQDMKINQVDLIDFDLRTHLDGKLGPARAYAYGHTWFTIMSPQIKSYTIGLQPNLAGGWFPGPDQQPASVEGLSWLGRPEFDGPAAMGRPRVQTFSRRSYAYQADAAGLVEVPIPVWTTKSFTASWETPLAAMPFRADLTYHLDKELIISGTLQSFLPVNLEDVWIFYRNRCYPLAGSLEGNRGGGPVRPITLDQRSQDIQGWPGRAATTQERPVIRQGSLYDPTSIIKEILFHEQADMGVNLRNHSLQRLDQSWRLHEDPRGRVLPLREAILFARVRPAIGPAEALARSQEQPLPALLWLDELPRPGKTRPALPGSMVQDTFLRVFLPLKPPNN